MTNVLTVNSLSAAQAAGVVQELNASITPGEGIVYHEGQTHQITYVNTGNGVTVHPGMP